MDQLTISIQRIKNSMKLRFRILAACAAFSVSFAAANSPAVAQSKKPQSAKASEPKGCSLIPKVYAYTNVSYVHLSDAMSKLDLTKKELEKEDEFEKRKKDAWASINIPKYEIGSRKFYGFFAPLKRTWLKYDVEKEQFWFNPTYKDTFLGGGTEIDVFGKNLHITNSRVTHESELKPLGTYEGSNAFGKQVTVYVADLQQYALDLPEFSDMKFFGRQMQSFKLPVARTALGGSLDDVGVLILGDLRKHGYAKIDSRKEPSIQVPLDQRITKHIFFVTPVCAYFFNIATQTVLSEIPHFGEGWGEF